jgi:hypothetical protein
MVLLLVSAVMVSVTLAILTFRMLMIISYQLEDNAIFNPQNGKIIGSIANTLWVSLMNLVYKQLAVLFNDLENHRTDTEHENALIAKTFVFQFCNSCAHHQRHQPHTVRRCEQCPASAQHTAALISALHTAGHKQVHTPPHEPAR